MDLGLVCFRLGRLHLTLEGQEALMQRDLLGSGLVSVVEPLGHARNVVRSRRNFVE